MGTAEDRFLIVSPVPHPSPTLGPPGDCPLDAQGGTLGGEEGVQACPFPKAPPFQCPDAPQTHLARNVDGEEDPGQYQHGKDALQRKQSGVSFQPRPGAPGCLSHLEVTWSACVSASVSLLLAEWLTLPGRHVFMFKWEEGMT